MIRILYISDTLMSGGIERQLTELITRLDPTRFEVHVICLYAGRAGRSLYFLERLQASSIPVYVLDRGWSSRDKGLAIWQLVRLIWRIRPHIVQAMNYHSNLLTRMARIVMPPRTILIGTLRNASTRKQLRYERMSWFLCRTIICNSPHLRQQLTQIAHIPAHHIEVIPNGVDVDHFSRVPQPESIAAVRGDARCVFVTIGRFSDQKAHHLLIEALGLLKTNNRLPEGVRLVIVGEVEHSAQKYRDLVDEAVTRYGLQDVVTIHPQSSHPEAYYHAADGVILASLWEGLPNVALEALSSGRPLIISEAANLAGIVEHDVTGWVVRTGDVEHLAHAVERVLALEETALEKMRRACSLRAQDYAVPNMVRQYEALYERLIAKPSPKTRPAS